MKMNLTTIALLQRCCALATSTWSDALDQLGIAGVIQGLALQSGSGCVAGVALTVQETVGPLQAFPREAFAVGSFLDALSEGNILVIEMGGAEVSTFGGLAAQATRNQGAAGVVINGGCRDLAAIRETGLWVPSKRITPISGQNPNELPYDPNSSLTDQVAQSFASSFCPQAVAKLNRIDDRL